MGGVVCTEGAAVLLKAAQKLSVALVWYFLVAVLAASSLALTSWVVWVVLCFSSLVRSSTGISSMRVGVGDGLEGRYSIETSSSSSLKVQRSMGWMHLTGSILIFRREALRYLRDLFEELEVVSKIRREEVCIVEAFGLGLRMEW